MNSRIGNTCLSRFGNQVKDGAYFTPIGSDVCTKCQCIGGQAVGCFAQLCKEPTCDKFKYLDGKCCEFECLEGDGLSAKGELAVIISLSIGLVLLLVILIAIFYCRRQSLKKKDEQKPELKAQSDTSVTEQTQSSSRDDEHPSGSNNRTSSNSRHIEEQRQSGNIELPPPYSPPENIESVGKSRPRQRLPPNEPPPPYDREESTV